MEFLFLTEEKNNEIEAINLEEFDMAMMGILDESYEMESEILLEEFQELKNPEIFQEDGFFSKALKFIENFFLGILNIIEKIFKAICGVIKWLFNKIKFIIQKIINWLKPSGYVRVKLSDNKIKHEESRFLGDDEEVDPKTMYNVANDSGKIGSNYTGVTKDKKTIIYTAIIPFARKRAMELAKKVDTAKYFYSAPQDLRRDFDNINSDLKRGDKLDSIAKNYKDMSEILLGINESIDMQKKVLKNRIDNISKIRNKQLDELLKEIEEYKDNSENDDFVEVSDSDYILNRISTWQNNLNSKEYENIEAYVNNSCKRDYAKCRLDQIKANKRIEEKAKQKGTTIEYEISQDWAFRQNKAVFMLTRMKYLAYRALLVDNAKRCRRSVGSVNFLCSKLVPKRKRIDITATSRFDFQKLRTVYKLDDPKEIEYIKSSALRNCIEK